MKSLDQRNFVIVKESLNSVNINNLFAHAVIDKKVDGNIYVDKTENPTTFYISHPYGMSLLFGETENESFNSELVDYALNTNRIRNRYEWLQTFPKKWNNKFSELLGEKLVKTIGNKNIEKKNAVLENTRVNFRFNKEKYLSSRRNFTNPGYSILPTDEKLYEQMQGSVVPRYFWKNAKQFCEIGTGFSLILENKVVSTAYSAFVHEDKLEIGIETTEEARGKGFAVLTCSSLIDYCLETGYEPVWSCRFENTPSYKLAQRLGFEPILYIPFYRLLN